MEWPRSRVADVLGRLGIAAVRRSGSGRNKSFAARDPGDRTPLKLEYFKKLTVGHCKGS